MSFVAKHIVNADERIMYVARLHWVCVCQGLLWFLSFWAIGAYVSDWLSALKPEDSALGTFYLGDFLIQPKVTWFLYLMLAGGTFLFSTYLAKMLSTEIALTDQRIIFKTGLIFTEVEEIDLHEIRAERVKHGLFGRLLNYGRVYLDCRFVGDVTLPRIRRPYRFLKAMHKVDKSLGPEPVVR